MTSSSQITRKLNGAHTELVLHSFSDRILVLVTQMGKVGNLIQATIPPTTPLLPIPAPDSSQPNVEPLPIPPAAIQLTPLLGSAASDYMQTLHSLYAAQIATIIWTAESEGPLEVSRRSVIVGIALQKSSRNPGEGLAPREREVFRGVMSMLRELVKPTEPWIQPIVSW